jgi:putative ABC transport system substrate-binding protein
VAQPLRYEFIINLKTVRAMGLTIPRALWLRTDETIE